MAFDKTLLQEEQQIKSKDNRVIFDETTHTYYYNGQPLISTTQFIKTFVKEFDPLFPSINKSKKNKVEKIGISDPKLLRKYWRLSGERSSTLGTTTHTFAEMYKLDKTTKPKTGYEKAVIKAMQWLEEQGWEIVIQEEVVYNTNYLIAGSIDLKLRHKVTGEWGIGDWKITDDMHKSYNKMFSPFDKLNDSALNKYSVQLDIYSMLSDQLIAEYNRFIIQLHDNGDFTVYHPKQKDKKLQLPFTMDLSKKALAEYIKKTKPLNK